MHKRGAKVGAIALWLCFIFMGQGQAAVSHDSTLNWQTLESENFRVHFHDGLHDQAKRVARIAEDVHRRLVGYFSWSPEQATDIVLMDEVDYANGYALPHPSNRMVLWLNPPEDGLMDFGPWMESLITHEYVHILHLDKASGAPKSLRNVFGRHPLLLPAIFQPNWLIEGLATYIETDQARGIGRGQSSFFDMVMRSETLNGLKPLRQVNQTIASWPGGNVAYLYGVEFYKFLAQRYGDEKIKMLISRYSDNLLPAALNTTMKQVFGKDLSALWLEFSAHMTERYTVQRDNIVRAGLVEGEPLTQSGYCTGRPLPTRNGDVVYLRCDGKSQFGLYLKSPQHQGDGKRLLDVFGPVNFDINADDVIVLAQPELFHNANTFYDLYRYDLNDKSLTRLTEGKRYRYAAWSRDGQRIAAVRFARGRYFLDVLDAQGKFLENLWQGEDDEIVSYLDWSPVRDEIVATVWRSGRGWNIELFSLSERAWTALTADDAIKVHPSYAREGESIVFSADYDGVFNLYEMALPAKRITKLSHVLSGAFSPAYLENGDLLYVGNNAQGFDIYRLAKTAMRNEETTPRPGATYVAQAANDELPPNYRLTEYQPGKSLWPTWWNPIFGFDEHTTLLGAVTSGSDPLFRHNYLASLAYDSESASGFGGFSYSYDRWPPILSMTYYRLLARETNEDGSLRKVRRSDFVQAAVDLPFLKLRHQWALHAGVVSDEERDGYMDDAALPEAAQRDRLLGLGMSYNSSRRYPLSASRNDGRVITLKHENSDIFLSDYEGNVATLDWREFVSLGGEHVLALRAMVGEGDVGSKVFQLGGYESQDFLPVSASAVGMSFGQRKYPLRGYPQGYGPLTGYHARLFSAEWRFPLTRVERGWMAPPLSLDQLSGALFYDAGTVWITGANKESYRTGIGAELYMDSYLLYRLPFRMRLGYAKGQDEGGDAQVYLRLGTSF